MTDNIGKQPEEWRNFSTTIPIPAFHLKRDDLKKLYKIISQKQIEVRDRMMNVLAQQATETDEQFSERKNRVYNSFVTSITFTGVDGECFHGNNEESLNSHNIPEQLTSVFMSTISVPKAVIGFTPLCNVSVLLDFSRSPIIDFSSIPNSPTKNGSNIVINADNESWFTSTRANLIQFIAGRKTGFDWLHGAGIYDILLIFFGIPAAIYFSHRVGGYFEGYGMHQIINVAILAFIVSC